MLSVCKSASRKQAKKYFAKKLKNFIKILDKNEKNVVSLHTERRKDFKSKFFVFIVK